MSVNESVKINSNNIYLEDILTYSDLLKFSLKGRTKTIKIEGRELIPSLLFSLPPVVTIIIAVFFYLMDKIVTFLKFKEEKS